MKNIAEGAFNFKEFERESLRRAFADALGHMKEKHPAASM